METTVPHVFTLRVREADCDPYGHARTASYLTFLYESQAGTRLRTEPGWMAPRSYLEFYLPLLPSERVEVKSWAIFYGPQSEVRAYEFRKTGSGDLSARGTAEWVRLEETPIVSSPTLSASDIPTNGGDPNSAPETIQFPEAPPPPPGIFTQSRQVAWCELGLDYKLTATACLEYLIECAIQTGHLYGWSLEVSQEYGLAFVVRKQWLEIFDLPSLGVQVRIDTWLSHVKRSTCLRHYIVRRVVDGVLLARGHTLWVCVDPSTGAPMRIPPRFIEDFRPHIAG